MQIISVEDPASKQACHTKSACIREACWKGSQTEEGSTWVWGRRSGSYMINMFLGTPWSNQQGNSKCLWLFLIRTLNIRLTDVYICLLYNMPCQAAWLVVPPVSKFRPTGRGHTLWRFPKRSALHGSLLQRQPHAPAPCPSSRIFHAFPTWVVHVQNT